MAMEDNMSNRIRNNLTATLIVVIILSAIILFGSGCSAMTLKTHRVLEDGSVVDVTLKSDREYAYFELTYNPETKVLEITASEVKTGPDAWAPVVNKLVDKIPNVP